MKKKLAVLLCSVMCCVLLGACGKDPRLEAFKDEVNNFCNNLLRIHEEINEIDPQKNNAPQELLSKMDELKGQFAGFAAKDFPEEFDYLEELVDEASSYMNVAADSYHNVFDDDLFYDEAMEEYAHENYARAYKRIRIVLSFIRGEEPEGDDIQIEYATE
ncbi:MAG: hypothetical protein IKL06_01740 [Lachnospiraceae bacterium]|nr:hypothetical protein [Lachnospiraceae bacterium]